MSMSTHIVGFCPPDEKWNKMKAIWEACDKASVAIPKEVAIFFNDEHPTNKPGMEVNIDIAVKKWRTDYCEGYEVEIDKLPEHIKIVRFYIRPTQWSDHPVCAVMH